MARRDPRAPSDFGSSLAAGLEVDLNAADSAAKVRRFGIVLATDVGIERITTLHNGLKAAQELSRLVEAVGPELQALSDAIVMRGPAFIASELPKRSVTSST